VSQGDDGEVERQGAELPMEPDVDLPTKFMGSSAVTAGAAKVPVVGGVLVELLHGAHDRRLARAAAWLDEAWRQSGMERGAFVAVLSENELLQEILDLALQVVVKTGQDRKRRVASYVLRDAVTGRLDIDQSRLS
jgi:hypothetical protein